MAFSFICSGATGIPKVRGYVAKSVSKSRTWKKVIKNKWKQTPHARLFKMDTYMIRLIYHCATLVCNWTSTKINENENLTEGNLKHKNMQKP